MSPTDYDKINGHNALRDLFIQMLRASGGSSNTWHLLMGLQRVVTYAEFISGATCENVIREIAEDLTDQDSIFDNSLYRIVKSALKVAAEAVSSDPAAKGRESQRQDGLLQSIDVFLERHPRGKFGSRS